ncbi:AAA family ATPase [Chloroflexota bacterium]
MTRPYNFNDILTKLPGAKQSGDHWIAPCPLTEHRTPAGHLTLKDGGDKALVTCQGGRHSYQDICQAFGFTSLTYSRNGNGPEDNKQKTLVATFSYECEKDKEAYQIRRFDLGNGSKTFEAWHKEGGKYVSGVGEYKDKPILYHLPEIPDWIATGKRIYIPEGELKVDRIITQGGAATTSPFGAGRKKWRSEYSTVLAGAGVIILPDNDKTGHDFGQDKATSLYGIAKRVKVLELPELPEKGDIIDWFIAGGTFEQLEQLASEAPEYKPKDSDTGLVCIADVEPETVAWLWLPYIPRGKLTLLEGDPGIGKSWVSLAIATAISLGNGLPGIEATEPQPVLLASAEDGRGDTIRPRLDNMGANVKNIHAIKETLDFGNGGLVILEGYIDHVRPALVIIDPLVAYIGAGVDIHRANETRAVMAKLSGMAERHGCAILAVRHLTKGGTLKPIYRGLGSIDFAAACRSVLMAGCDPSNEQKRGIVQIKSNLAPKGQAIGFELRDGGFYWTGESDLTAARIMAVEDTGEGKSARDEAADFLRDELRDGPVEAAQVWRDAREAGLSEITVKRAKAILGIITRRQGETGKRGGGKFTWELPDSEVQKGLGYQGYPTEENDTLNNASLKSDPLPKTDDTLNTPESVLGMPIEKAIELWRSEGAPVIHLGVGENCFDLARLLSNPSPSERHLEAVRVWLEEVLKKSVVTIV